ncbi:MAG: anti-sigma factor [Dehalococcoidia bacterium]
MPAADSLPAAPPAANGPLSRPPIAALPTAPSAPRPRRAGRTLLLVGGWLAAAAALVVAVGLGAWNVALQRDLERRGQEVVTRQRAIDALAQGGQLVAFDVRGPGLGSARGSVLRPAGGQPVAIIDGLSRPADGHVYQLWAVHADRAVDLGTFLPEERGPSIIPLGDLGSAQAVAVTVEAGRVPQPTSPPVLVAPLRVTGAIPTGIVTSALPAPLTSAGWQ